MNVHSPELISPAGLFPSLSGESKNFAGPRRDMYFIITTQIFSTALEAWTCFLSTSHPRSGITSLPADDYPQRLGRQQCAQRKAGQFALIKLQREAGASVLSLVCSLIPFARSCCRWEVQHDLRWPVPPALRQPCPTSLNLFQSLLSTVPISTGSGLPMTF